MTGLLDNLQKSTFRGIEFFISENDLEGGRKQATFDFINTGRRSVQDLGEFKKIHYITAYVMGDADTYLSRRDDLLKALDEAGSGELIHPFYGSITVATGKYRLKESFRSLGYSTITFTATETDTTIISEDGNPFSTINNQITPSSIADDAQNAKDQLAADTADNTTLIPEFPSNYSSMEQIINSGLEEFQDTLKPIADNVENATQWVSGITGLIDDTSRLLNNRNVLFSNIIDGVTGVDGLTDDATTSAIQLTKLFDTGQTSGSAPNNVSDELILASDDEALPVETNTAVQQPEFVAEDSQQIDRRTNADQVNIMYQTSALIEYMNQSARIDYQNQEEIDTNISTLETQYNKLAPLLSENSLDALSELRSNLRILLDDERLNVNSIVEIDVQDEPLSVLSFRLYGSTDQAETIVELNNISDVFAINGTIEVESSDRSTG